MTDEQDFLAAIAADPGDVTSRLVYADWLEERGDPRGEYLRVLDGLDTESVFVPRYWELKQRRNELRWNIDPAWREHFGDGDAYMPLFTKLPTDRQARWRLVDRFIDYWHEPLGPKSGNTEEEIAEAEEYVGRPLPAAMKEWYRLAGRRLEVWSKHDNHLSLTSLRDMPEVDALIFRSEIMGAVIWGIRNSNLQQDDPPVSVTSSESNQWKSRNESPTVSAFAVLALVYETVWASSHAVSSLDDHAFQEVSNNFELCNLPKHYQDLDPFELFEGRDILLMLSAADHFVGIGIRNDGAYDQLSLKLKQVFQPRIANDLMEHRAWPK